MKSVFRTLMLVVALAAFGAGGAFGETLGKFEIATADGKKFTHESLQDTTLMVFAQTACSQCRNEITALDAVYGEIKDKADVYIVLVDMNSERGVKYFTDKGIQIPLLLDPDFSLPLKAGLRVTPATIIVNKKGEVVFSETGYGGDTIEKIVGAL